MYGDGTLEIRGASRVAKTFRPSEAAVVLNGQDVVAEGGEDTLTPSMDVGGVNGRSAEVSLTAGTLATRGAYAAIGDNGGTGALYVSGGVYTAESDLVVGRAGGSGTLEVSGEGRVVLNANFRLAENDAATGVIVIREGGVVEADALAGGTGASTVVFDGGTLKLTNADAGYFEGVRTILVREGGGVIDTGSLDVSADFDNIVFAGGRLRKTGSGSLSINTIPFANGLVVEEGTLRLSTLASAADAIIAAGLKRVASAPVAPIPPASGKAPVLFHQYVFEEKDLRDSVGDLTLEDGNPNNPAVFRNTDDDTDNHSENDYILYCPGTNGGTGNYIILPAGFLPGSGEATVEFWIYPGWFPASKLTLLALGAAGSELRIAADAGAGNNGGRESVTFYLEMNGTRATFPVATPEHVWHHFVLSLRKYDEDGGVVATLSLYDGNQNETFVDSVEVSNPEWTFDERTEGLLNAAFNNGNGFASIEYADIRVWDGAMVPAHVAATARAGCYYTPTLVDVDMSNERARYESELSLYQRQKAEFDAYYTTLVRNNYLSHRITFNGTLKDAVTGFNPETSGTVHGPVSANADGQTYTFAGGTKADGAWLDLRAGYLPTRGEAVTLEAWFTPRSVQKWSKLFYFGNDADHNLLFTLCENGTHQMSAGVNRQNYGGTQHVGEYGAKMPEWTEDREYYLSVVIDGNTSTFNVRDAATGELLGTAVIPGYSLDSQNGCSLGGGNPLPWGDACADVLWNEFRVWNAVLSDDLLQLSCLSGPDNPLTLETAQTRDVLLGCGGTFETEGDVDLSNIRIVFVDEPETVSEYIEEVHGWTFVRTNDGVITGLPQFEDLKAYGLKLVGGEGSSFLQFRKRGGVKITIR